MREVDIKGRTMITILLADDHAIIRTGLKLFIANYVAHSVIDEAWDGVSAFEKIKANDYQLIVLDVNMPETDSMGLVSNIFSVKADANILMFSMNPEEIYAKKYLQLGVKGYLSKSAPEDEIRKAIDTVLSGKRYMSPAISQSLVEDALGNKTNNPFEDLSPREFEIVLHLIKGETSSQICEALNLQSSTVATYKARLYTKLKCNNVIELNELAKLFNIIPTA